MLSKAENTRLNRELKELIDKYQRNYDDLRQTSENRYKASLQPGQTFHAKQGFYDDQTKAEFAKVSDEYWEKAHKLVDQATLDIMEANTAAPSTEATNTIMLLNTRQNVSESELDQLMSRYGRDCPQAYRALYEIGQRMGYHNFNQHPVAAAAENVDRLNSVIDRTFNVGSADRNMVVNAAAFVATLNDAFPTE